MRFSRASTSSTTAFMSEPTSNSSPTHEAPWFDHDCISVIPDNPSSTSSTCSVISDSTWVGAAARHGVKTDSVGRSMSGNSCTGSVSAL